MIERIFRKQNADAYLLFYRRRTDKPLGGKLQERISEFKEKAEERKKAMEMSPPPLPVASQDVPITIDLNGLPTPPEDNSLRYPAPPDELATRLERENGSRWALRSGTSVSSLTPSDGPPELSDPYMDQDGLDAYNIGPNPSGRGSPTSSLDPTQDTDWNGPMYQTLRSTRDTDLQRMPSSGSLDNWAESGSNLASPSYSNVSSSENTNETGKKTYTTALDSEDPVVDDNAGADEGPV